MKLFSSALIVSLLAGTAYSLPRAVKTVPNPFYYTYASCGLKNGGFASVSRVNSTGGNTVIAITTFDSLGNVSRSGKIPNPNTNSSDIPYSVFQTQDGGLAIRGRIYGDPQIIVPLFLKLDSLGQVQFRKTYGDGAVSLQSIVETPDSGFILGLHNNFKRDSTFPVLLKLDKHGNPVWQREFKDFGASHWRSLKAAADGGVVATGTMIQKSTGYEGKVLLKFDSLGGPVWERRFTVNDRCFLQDLEPREGGGWLVAGGCFTGGNYFFKAGVKEFDEEGFEIKSNLYQDDSGSTDIKALLPMDGGWIANVVGVRGSTNSKLWKMDAGRSIVWEYPLEYRITFEEPFAPIRQGPGKFVICPQECIMFEDAD